MDTLRQIASGLNLVLMVWGVFGIFGVLGTISKKPHMLLGLPLVAAIIYAGWNNRRKLRPDEVTEKPTTQFWVLNSIILFFGFLILLSDLVRYFSTSNIEALHDLVFYGLFGALPLFVVGALTIIVVLKNKPIT